MFFVKNIPQEKEFWRSFNVLVPLEIQGKQCELVSRGGTCKRTGRSISHGIRVGGNYYSVPVWSVMETLG